MAGDCFVVKELDSIYKFVLYVDDLLLWDDLEVSESCFPTETWLFTRCLQDLIEGVLLLKVVLIFRCLSNVGAKLDEFELFDVEERLCFICVKKLLNLLFLDLHPVSAFAVFCLLESVCELSQHALVRLLPEDLFHLLDTEVICFFFIIL